MSELDRALAIRRLARISRPKIGSAPSCTGMHWEEKKFDHDPRSAREFALPRGTMRMSKKSYFAVTRLCVMACTDSAIRFCTPTFRISLAT